MGHLWSATQSKWTVKFLLALAVVPNLLPTNSRGNNQGSMDEISEVDLDLGSLSLVVFVRESFGSCALKSLNMPLETPLLS